MEPKDRQLPPDARAQHRAYVLEHVVNGGLTIDQAATILKPSTRQVDRLLARYGEGPAALAHGNRGRTPANRLGDAQRALLVELATTTYAGVNHTPSGRSGESWLRPRSGRDDDPLALGEQLGEPRVEIPAAAAEVARREAVLAAINGLGPRADREAAPPRLAVVDALAASDRSPSDLGHALGIDSNLLAHHLETLERAGLIERVVSSIGGVDYVESQSRAGISTVTVHLKLNHSSTAALAEVTARLQQVRAELPSGALPPRVAGS